MAAEVEGEVVEPGGMIDFGALVLNLEVLAELVEELLGGPKSLLFVFSQKSVYICENT